MEQKESSYKRIFKATSILGGVQFYNIIINIIRSKVIAVLLGPSGIGLLSIFTNTINLVSQLSNFGLGTSAIKDVAIASNESDYELSKVVSLVNKLVVGTGILGFILTVIFSSFLSQISFNNSNYTLSFLFLAFSVLFTQITTGNNVILQGTSNIKGLAKANAIGASLGLIISLPFYYYLGNDGIVPTLIVSAFVLMIVSFFFAKRLDIKKFKVSNKLLKVQGWNIIKLGFIISLSSTVSLLVSYLVRIFINYNGGMEDVGFYTAGFAIINTYVGMVFTAMTSEYYPRLSKICDNISEANQTINEQVEMALMILSPILVIFLVFIKWGIVLLYSQQFLVIIPMMQWAIIGIFFKALSWPIAFIFLAKGNSKLFFWNEILANVYILVLNVLGYYFFGLKGLGVSFLISYVLYLIQVFFICKNMYSYRMPRSIIFNFLVQLFIAILCLAAVSEFNGSHGYLAGGVLIVISLSLSLRELQRKINFLKK
ncbi:oligosaccharide flippase family protein [Sphingobacterium sp. UBA2074]|uniref:oligosaccharide flippase family protein n=1 Tax=Sphingobacterium sp. UBA2074 TaxID=1947487 RepID=UPI00257D068B|nr:oligosaccharide flippase family protein [Sphingobacterium sp. UBA2074]